MRLLIALCLCVCVAFACDQLWSSSVVPCGQPGFDCPPGVTPPGQDLAMEPGQDLSMAEESDGGVLTKDMTGQPPNDFPIGPPTDASGLELPAPPLEDMTVLGPPDQTVIIVTK